MLDGGVTPKGDPHFFSCGLLYLQSQQGYAQTPLVFQISLNSSPATSQRKLSTSVDLGLQFHQKNLFAPGPRLAFDRISILQCLPPSSPCHPVQMETRSCHSSTQNPPGTPDLIQSKSQSPYHVPQGPSRPELCPLPP